MKYYSDLARYIYPVFQYYESARLCPEIVPLRDSADADLLRVYQRITEYVADQKVTFKFSASPFFNALSTLDETLNKLWHRDYIYASDNLIDAIKQANVVIGKQQKYFVGPTSKNIIKSSKAGVTAIDNMRKLMDINDLESSINDIYAKLKSLRIRTMADLTPLQNELNRLSLSFSDDDSFDTMQTALKTYTQAIETEERNLASAEKSLINGSLLLTGAAVAGGLVYCLISYGKTALTAGAYVPVALACTAATINAGMDVYNVVTAVDTLNTAVANYNDFVRNIANEPFILYIAINGWLETANRVIRNLDRFKDLLDVYISYFNENSESVESYMNSVNKLITAREEKWLSAADIKSLENSFSNIKNNFKFDNLKITYTITKDSMVCFKVLAAKEYHTLT
ncbi:hypothetical protein HX776_20275 [Pseudomonas agarici]|uniref:hypothetical protein n=3 Tax=Pseudomonas agarici TaxID=46677 RepID=UPI0008B511E6|nr:hypothetical protein [Pseudomonas agarici]NWC11134.1 hypothetical protein [Pseudomonas agarici]SEL57972.1 hypothetical protein SAMN05216604_1236 [Pseudomonas agarici]